jgi:hypothetical protein
MVAFVNLKMYQPKSDSTIHGLGLPCVFHKVECVCIYVYINFLEKGIYYIFQPLHRPMHVAIQCYNPRIQSKMFTERVEKLDNNEILILLKLYSIAKISSIAYKNIHDCGLKHTSPHFICGCSSSFYSNDHNRIQCVPRKITCIGLKAHVLSYIARQYICVHMGSWSLVLRFKTLIVGS